MFNSITKKLKGDQPAVKKTEEVEGFICPICMISFSSPEMVQRHFDEKHPEDNNTQTNSQTEAVFSPSTQRKESIRDIQENLNDLRQSLDEEVWYNEELKKECTRLTALVQKSDNEIVSRDKVIEDYTKQISDVEAARDTLSEELKKMQISRTSLMAENKTIRSDFRVCEEKMIQLEQSRDDLAQTVERQHQECTELSAEISRLRSSDNADDDQRLSQYNEQLTNANNELQSKEQELKDLETEFNKLKSQQLEAQQHLERKCEHLSKEVEQLQTEMSSLVLSKEKLSIDYETQLQQSLSDSSEVRFKYDDLKEKLKDSEDNLTKMKRNWDVDKAQLEDLNARLKESADNVLLVKSQNQDLVQKLKNQEVEILQIRNSSSNKDEEIKVLQKSAKNSADELTNVKLQLESERKSMCELQSKVEMTDAGAILMEQLQLEKRNLQETIVALKSQLEEELQRTTLELSTSRMEIQSQKEEILNLTTLLSEKEEKVKEFEKKSSDVQIVCEKYQQKVNEEISSRSGLEDRIMGLTRELQGKEEMLTASMQSQAALKRDHEVALRHCEQERDKAREDVAASNKQIESLTVKVMNVQTLQKEVEEKNAKITKLEGSIESITDEHRGLLQDLDGLRASEDGLKRKLQIADEQVKSLTESIDTKCRDIESQLTVIKSKEEMIMTLQVQVADSAKVTNDLSEELTKEKRSTDYLRSDLDEKNKEIVRCRESIENMETELSQIHKDKDHLESEFDTLKKNNLEQDAMISKLCKEKEYLENISTEREEANCQFKEALDSIRTEKDAIESQLGMAKIQIEETQSLYSESMRIQNVNENEIKRVSEELEKATKHVQELSEENKNLRLQYSTETEKLRKEGIQLKNHVSALEKTLNESSENYKQEIVDSTERELTLKSHCEELESDMVKLTKSLQRNEEDLESEKCLRQTERNNMMEKISQLTDQVAEWQTLRSDLEQKLDTVETDNIEIKIRFDAEKEKLLDNIIQLENNLKRQNETLAKKSREFDQLQSAILDLGRENQSLQITKEKITSRLWIVDDEAVQCHNCHKPFSLTNRKHHCRNCGQVFCQDCSMKTATLAVSRKPVRVCDVCHLEVHSHRRHSSTQSSTISLSLQN